MTYRATATTAALASLGSLPNTGNTIDRALEGILLGQQPLDAALTASKAAISVQLNVAGRHCDGCFVTGDGFADWYYVERMNGPYFSPKMFVTMCGTEGLQRAKIRYVCKFPSKSLILKSWAAAF